jgi:lipoprotein NlpD
MTGFRVRLGALFALLVAGLMLEGCGSKALNRAPVEDRAAMPIKSAPAAMAVETTVPVIKQPAGVENAGKPGYYTVKPGDTLIRIGLEHGQSYKDISRWSGVENPNRIEVGQVLRVEPPQTGEVVTRPVALASVTSIANAPARSASADKALAPPAMPSSAASAPAVATTVEDEISWIWPTNGALLAGFDELKNKGLDIGGSAGEPVLAAADGRVVYVGAGLRGYGNLIILKHNNTYLSAYAHNQTLLIKEDQTVRRGQKIAEMGSSDADRVKLHFEVRRQGKPVDPVKYLPAR